MKLFLMLFLIFTSNSYGWKGGNSKDGNPSKKVSVAPAPTPHKTAQTTHPDCPAPLSDEVRRLCPNSTPQKEGHACVFRCRAEGAPLKWDPSDKVEISVTTQKVFKVTAQ